MNDLSHPDFLHKNELSAAKALLENPGLAARMTDVLGVPIEKGLAILPEKWQENVQETARLAIKKALDFAVMTMDNRLEGKRSSRKHKIAVAASGAIGGAFGLIALAAELPVSTVIMLRSIADIAKHEGEDIKLLETKLACLEVFALGGRSRKDNASEAGYYAVRSVLASSISDAASHIAKKGITEEGAPALVRLISRIATRFGVVVSEKVAAAAIPIIGAVGGATINTIFIDHFQKMAKGHFAIRRLERIYGKEMVQKEYERN